MTYNHVLNRMTVDVEFQQHNITFCLHSVGMLVNSLARVSACTSLVHNTTSNTKVGAVEVLFISNTIVSFFFRNFKNF